MNIFSKKTLFYGAVMSIILAVSVNQKESGNDFKGTKTISTKQLTTDIDRINSNIVELKPTSNLHPQNDIKNKLNKLNAEIAILRDQFDSLSNTVALDPSIADNGGNDENPLSEEEQLAVLKKQVKEQINLYDDTAVAEGVDQEWATDAQANIYESFNDLNESGIGVSDVKCHRSFCQVAFVLEDDHSVDAVQKIQEIAPWEDSEAFIWIEDIDQGEGAIYLSREGDKLPTIDG